MALRGVSAAFRRSGAAEKAIMRSAPGRPDGVIQMSPNQSSGTTHEGDQCDRTFSSPAVASNAGSSLRGLLEILGAPGSAVR